jgi:hypothetical protein
MAVPRSAAQLDPFSVAVDAAGNVYVTDLLQRSCADADAQVVKPASMSIVSGNGQSAPVGTNLAAPLVLKNHRQYRGGRSGSDCDLYSQPGRGRNCPACSRDHVERWHGYRDMSRWAAIPGRSRLRRSPMRWPTLRSPLTALASNSPSIATGGITSAGLSNPPVKVLSPNAIVTIFGTNFAPAGTAKQAGLVNGQLPTNVAGVCVEFGTVAAPIFGVYPTQINVQVPSVAPGNVPVQVITDCDTTQAVASPPVSVPAQATRPSSSTSRQLQAAQTRLRRSMR